MGRVKVRGKNSSQYWASEKTSCFIFSEDNNITNLGKTKISKITLGLQKYYFSKRAVIINAKKREVPIPCCVVLVVGGLLKML